MTATEAPAHPTRPHLRQPCRRALSAASSNGRVVGSFGGRTGTGAGGSDSLIAPKLPLVRE